MSERNVSELNVSRIRAQLAARRISRAELATASGLSRTYVSSLLCGRPAGELARMKLARGLIALGLNSETPHAA
jgi:transcriptional regulator with XRE-family HTH domain